MDDNNLPTELQKIKGIQKEYPELSTWSPSGYEITNNNM
jgi:hypothetical protein